MTDVLIRNVPDDVIEAIESKAKRLGLSRSEYLRQTLARETAFDATGVTVDDLESFAERCADLGDPEVMRLAWS